MSEIIISENVFVQWISASFFLTTVSLLFFHIVRSKTIEMPTRIAGLFSVVLILLAATIMIIGIIPYFERNKKNARDESENIYRIIYTIIGILLAVIQVGISIAIIRGVFRTKSFLPM